MITNESKGNEDQGWPLYYILYVLPSGWFFSINPLILSCFSLTSFHLAEVSLSTFSGLHVSQKRGFKRPKISQNIFYLWLLTFLVLILQSTWFICRNWKRKQSMEQQLYRGCEKTKSKQKQNQVTSSLN